MLGRAPPGAPRAAGAVRVAPTTTFLPEVPMPIDSLQALYDAKLQLILDAEQQGLVNNPSLIEQVRHDDLRQLLQTHLQQTERQVEMLQPLAQAGAAVGQAPVCLSMQALFQEAQQMVGQIQDPDARDAYVIAAAQAIEHHEIAAYGTARSWAQQLGRDDDVRVLEEILEQEKRTDEMLTQLAERRVNQAAS
jgi:ferritin-like metal-binding protein YciE